MCLMWPLCSWCKNNRVHASKFRGSGHGVHNNTVTFMHLEDAFIQSDLDVDEFVCPTDL